MSESKAPTQRRRVFNDDLIRRSDLPRDAFGLIHDLCYDHEGRDRSGYKERAQKILKATSDTTVKSELIEALTELVEIVDGLQSGKVWSREYVGVTQAKLRGKEALAKAEEVSK